MNKQFLVRYHSSPMDQGETDLETVAAILELAEVPEDTICLLEEMPVGDQLTFNVGDDFMTAMRTA